MQPGIAEAEISEPLFNWDALGSASAHGPCDSHAICRPRLLLEPAKFADMKNIKLSQLSYFIAVAEEGNVNRAAARLNISQPPLTRQIQNLEASLGVLLFNRHSGGMALTEAGTIFLREAKNAQAVLELAVDRVRRAGRGEFGRLDVGVFGSGIFGGIPRIDKFRLHYPDVDVHIHWMNKDEQLQSLRQGLINVAFSRLVEPQNDIIIECLDEESLYLAVAHSSPIANLREVDLAACHGEDFIMFPTTGRPGFYDNTLELCRDAGFFPKIAQQVEDIMTGIALVAAGFGVALITKSATAIAIRNVSYVKLVSSTGTPTVDLSLMYLRNATSPVLENFIEISRSLRRP